MKEVFTITNRIQLPVSELAEVEGSLFSIDRSIDLFVVCDFFFLRDKEHEEGERGRERGRHTI